MLKSLLVGVLLWDLCPVESEVFEVFKQRSHLFLDVSLRDEDFFFFFNLYVVMCHPEMINERAIFNLHCI